MSSSRLITRAKTPEAQKSERKIATKKGRGDVFLGSRALQSGGRATPGAVDTSGGPIHLGLVQANVASAPHDGERWMPYRTNDDLPTSVQSHLPPHAQDIYREAFNHAFAAHAGDPRQEEAAHRIAWAAVKRAYVKIGSSWVARTARALS